MRSVAQSCLTLSDPMDCRAHLVEPTVGSSCPWKFSGKNTGVGCHFLLQGIILSQELNLCLLHWQVDSLSLGHLGTLLFAVESYWPPGDEPATNPHFHLFVSQTSPSTNYVNLGLLINRYQDEITFIVH